MKSTLPNHVTTELAEANEDAQRNQLSSDVQNRQQASRTSDPIEAGTIFVVLPAYNEAQGLPSLLKKIQLVFAGNGRDYHVIVVDDASTDDTAEIASRATFQMPLTLVRHKVNQNLPGALRSGFIEATRLAVDGDVIVTMDGDDTHQPGSINRLLQMIEDGYDVATCSRFQPGSRVCGVPPLRVFMAWGARMMFKTIMPIPGVRDYTCGYRAYRTNVLKEAMDFYGDEFVSEAGFSCMADVLLKMRRFKFVFGEVPMLLRYDQKLGGSKMAVANTAIMSLKLLVKRRLGGY
jgi:dolichol-phosphate mannosyltransferase